MTTEREHHVALPKLYGAPAQPHRTQVAVGERPLDADDLPLAAEMTEEERVYAERMASSGPSSAADTADPDGSRGPGARVRAFAHRLVRPRR